MKQPFRLFRRSNGGRFYLHDSRSGQQESLHTKDRAEAELLCQARNEALRQPEVNLQIARAYLTATDPEMPKRTWRQVMDALINSQREASQGRYERAAKCKDFDPIRDLPLLQTRPEHFMQVLEDSCISTNAHLRRFQQFALNMGWLPWPVLPRGKFPPLKYAERRAITRQEHEQVLAKETSPEWRAYLQLLWHLGAWQGDMASLMHENIDWKHRLLSFRRRKTGSLTVQRFGEAVASVFKELPRTGYLFPEVAKKDCRYRSQRFASRCRAAGVSGVTLHSYRYAWAERAKEAGYPERFAQEALGHRSAAVHQAYARKARVELPPLEEYELASGGCAPDRLRVGANVVSEV